MALSAYSVLRPLSRPGRWEPCMAMTALARRMTRIALHALRWGSVLVALYAAAGFLLLPWLAERQITALL
jgi:hypothetical protein